MTAAFVGDLSLYGFLEVPGGWGWPVPGTRKADFTLMVETATGEVYGLVQEPDGQPPEQLHPDTWAFRLGFWENHLKPPGMAGNMWTEFVKALLGRMAADGALILKEEKTCCLLTPNTATSTTKT